MLGIIVLPLSTLVTCKETLIMQEWAAISQDVAQKLIDSMPGWIAEVLKKRVTTANIDSLHQLHLIVKKSL